MKICGARWMRKWRATRSHGAGWRAIPAIRKMSAPTRRARAGSQAIASAVLRRAARAQTSTLEPRKIGLEAGLSMCSALDTSKAPGSSTLSDFTTPLSTIME